MRPAEEPGDLPEVLIYRILGYLCHLPLSLTAGSPKPSGQVSLGGVSPDGIIKADSRPRLCTLLHALRINKAWNAQASSILYATVSFDSGKDTILNVNLRDRENIQTLAGQLGSAVENPQYARHVRELRVSGYLPDILPAQSKLVPLLTRALKTFLNLERISISPRMYNERMFDEFVRVLCGVSPEEQAEDESKEDRELGPGARAELGAIAEDEEAEEKDAIIDQANPPSSLPSRSSTPILGAEPPRSDNATSSIPTHTAQSPSLRPALSSSPATQPLPFLRSLELNQSCTNTTSKVSSLLRLTTLSELSLVNPTRVLLQSLPEWLEALKPNLKELHLCGDCGSITPGVLRSFAPRLDSLEAFSLGVSFSLTHRDVFKFLGTDAMRDVRRLRLAYYAQMTRPPPCPLLHSLTSLIIIKQNPSPTNYEFNLFNRFLRPIIDASPVLETVRVLGKVWGGASPLRPLPSAFGLATVGESREEGAEPLDDDDEFGGIGLLANPLIVHLGFRAAMMMRRDIPHTLRCIDLRTAFVSVNVLQDFTQRASDFRLSEFRVCTTKDILIPKVFQSVFPVSRRFRLIEIIIAHSKPNRVRELINDGENVRPLFFPENSHLSESQDPGSRNGLAVRTLILSGRAPNHERGHLRSRWSSRCSNRQCMLGVVHHRAWPHS